MSRWIAVQFVSLLIVVIASCATGCNSYPPNLTVQLNYPPSDRKKVEVDVLACDDAQWQHFQTMSMSDYWKWGGEGRNQAANKYCRVFRLSTVPTDSTGYISKTDPIWQIWSSEPRLNHLVVIADLSNIAVQGPSLNDPRHAQLALDKKNLKYPEAITISVSPGGVRFSPLPQGNGKYFNAIE